MVVSAILLIALFAVISCAPKQSSPDTDSQSVQSSEKSMEDTSQDENISAVDKVMEEPPVSGDYEPYPVFKASELLEPEILKGENYEIVEEVTNDCIWNSYQINSDFGQYNARNTNILEIRVNEINATARLQQTSGGEALAVGAADSVINPFRSAINIATHPVDTVIHSTSYCKYCFLFQSCQIK